MKIINCHIDNFGKLSDYDCYFDGGCNIICQRNGWGKSTLMAFLRVMLYGFVNESKRSELENERKRYKPWQKGVYGGSLTFEAYGKTYRCYRVFGDKEKEDQFRLLDDATNLETDDFSEKLGEELFQIDQDSFFKSACIGQMKSDIRYVGATGSMSAKLGDLMEETGDISQFESVDKKLTDLLNRMSPRRATGSLYKQKKELEEYNFQITKKGKIEQTVTDIRRKRQEEAQRKERLEAERDQVNAKQKQLVFQEKQKHYQELVRERDGKREEYESWRKRFPKELPDESELKQKIKTAAEMEENHSAMEIYELSAEEEQSLKTYEDKFDGCPPEEEEMGQVRDAIQTWRNHKAALDELRISEEDRRKRAVYHDRFADGQPKEEELERQIRDWEKRNQKKEALATKKASLNMAKMMARQAREAAAKEAAAREVAAREAAARAGEEERKAAFARAEEEAIARKSRAAGMKLLFLASLVTVFVGVLLWVASDRTMGLVGILFGAAAAGITLIYSKRGQRRKGAKAAQHNVPADDGETPENNRGDIFAVDEKLLDDDEDIYGIDGEMPEEAAAIALEREILEDEEFIRETENKIRRYLETYQIAWEEYRISDELHRMKNAVREYQEIAGREERYRQQERECGNEELQEQIERFLGRYNALGNDMEDPAGEYGELLQRLVGDVEKYRQLKENRTHYAQRNEAYRQQKEELHRYLGQLSLEPWDDMHTQFLELQRQLGTCIEKRQTWQAAEHALEEYEKKEDCGAFSDEMQEEAAETAEQLYERQKEISAQMERVQNNIHAYQIQLEENEEKIERIEEQELLAEELRESYEAGLKKYEYLTKTQKYLRIAKEKLTEKYMAPLLNGFRKYYGILTGEEAVRYRLDANVCLTIEEQGLPRQPELLSAGYRDIAGLCMRMALIDAMYQEDAPFLLMDDPFVNYDEQNLRGGMDFLGKVSEKYQVIYFTCRKFETGS